MHKNLKITLGVATLSLVLLGGMLLVSPNLARADEGTDRPTIFSRVAEILGMEETKIDDAFKQAHLEKIDEAVAATGTN